MIAFAQLADPMTFKMSRIYVCPFGRSTRATLSLLTLLMGLWGAFALQALPVHAQDSLSIDDLLDNVESAPAKSKDEEPAGALPPTSADEPAAEKPAGETFSIDDLLGDPAPAGSEPAAEEPESPAATEEPTSQESSTPSAGQQAFEPAQLGVLRSSEKIDEIWHDLHEAFFARQYSRVTVQLDRLERIRRTLAIENLPTYSNALLQLAAQARQNADTEMENRLIQAAEQLSPDMGGVEFARANRRKADKVRFLGEWVQSFLHTYDGVTSRFAAYGYLALSVALAILGITGLFGLALMYRHINPLVFDLVQTFRFEREAYVVPRMALILMMLSPLALGWGALGIAPMWILIFFTYGSRGEKILAPLALIALIFVPFLAWKADQYFALSRSPTLLRILDAQRGRWDDDLLRDLRKLEGDFRGNQAVLFSLGLVQTKKGLGAEARQTWNEVIKLNPKRWQALNNAGASLLFEGENDEAIAYFKKGLGIDPLAAAQQYNLSLALLAKGENSNAQGALGRARTLNPEETAFWERRSPKGTIYERAAVVSLSNDELLSLSNDLVTLPPSGTPILTALGIRSVYDPIVLCVVILVALGILALISAKFDPAVACDSCGVGMKRTTKIALRARNICPQCSAAFYTKHAVDPESRLKKVVKVERYQRRRRWALRLLSIVFPGAAQLAAGQVATGVILGSLTLLLFNTALLLASGVPAADPTLLSEAPRWPLLAIVSPALFILIIVSVVRIDTVGFQPTRGLGIDVPKEG